ncbi:MAG: hypothetical protein ACXABY_05265, partial [Candidatus Thorarchaeota archaeon]
VSLFIPANIGLKIGNIMIMAFVLGISAVFFYVIRKDWRVTRKEGLLLLLLYITAQIALIYFTQYTI